MAKILRKLARIFGSEAPPNRIAVFGSLKNNDQQFSDDPDIIQKEPNWLGAWDEAVIGGNSPALEDMNAIQYVNSYQVAYLLQAGIPEWHSAQEYGIGNIVNIPAVGFTTATASATKGAVYTNNGHTFTVLSTVSAGEYLVAQASGEPEATGTLTKTSGTGDATIAYTLMAPFSQLYSSITDDNLNNLVTDSNYWKGFQLQPGKALQNLQTDSQGANQLWFYGVWNEVTTTTNLNVPSGFNYTTGTLTVPSGFSAVVNGNVNCAGFATASGTGYIQVNPGGSFRVF